MKGHKLVADNHDHYVIGHADGSQIQVAKAGLSAQMHAAISKFPAHKVEHHFEGGGAYSGLLDSAKAANPDADTTLPDAPLAQALRGEGSGAGFGWKPDAPRAVPSLDMTSNSRPGDDAAAAAGDLGMGSAVPPAPGPQTYPTPTGEAPAETAPQAAPQAGAAPAGFGAQYLQDATAAMNSAKGANNAKAEAEGQVAEDTVAANEDYLDKQATADAAFQTKHQELDARGEELFKQVSDGKIDPGHVWSSASTGSKVGMIAGMLLSGIGSGLTGQPNMAMGVINKAIDADIDAQKSNLAKKQGLLHHNMLKTHDLEAAHAQTRLDLLSTFKGQVSLAAAKQGGAIAQANAQSLNSQIDLQMAGLKQQVAQSSAMLNMANGGAQGGSADPNDIDPQRLRSALLLGSHGYPNGVPKEQAAQAMKEYGAFKRQKSVSATLATNFKTMQDNHGMGIGNGPMASEAKKKWEAAANVVGMTVDHELAGRVSEDSLHAIKENNMPRWGDSPETVATKLNVITDAISEANVKEANGYGTLITYGLLSPENPHISSSTEIQSKGRKR